MFLSRTIKQSRSILLNKQRNFLFEHKFSSDKDKSSPFQTEKPINKEKWENDTPNKIKEDVGPSKQEELEIQRTYLEMIGKLGENIVSTDMEKVLPLPSVRSFNIHF